MKRSLSVLGCLAIFVASCGGQDSSSQPQTSSAATTESAASTASAPSTAKMPGEKLIAKSDCVGCHNKTVKVVGPAYEEIAAKYPATEENINKLADVVIAGGKGNWGEVPMTAHASLSKEDAKEMVSWILSLSK